MVFHPVDRLHHRIVFVVFESCLMKNSILSRADPLDHYSRQNFESTIPDQLLVVMKDVFDKPLQEKDFKMRIFWNLQKLL